MENLIRESFWNVYRPGCLEHFVIHRLRDASSFLCRELIPGYLRGARGEYGPPEGYFAAEREPEAFEAFDALFPPREKRRLPGQLF